MLTPILCLCLAFNESTAESVLVRYDLKPVLGAYPHAAAIETLPLKPSQDSEFNVDEFDWDGFSADMLVDLIVSNIHPDEWDYSGRSINIDEDDGVAVMWVEAPAATQAEVRRFLEYVGRTAHRTANVRIDVYRPPASADLSGLIGGLGGDGLRALKAAESGLGPANTFHLALSSGRPRAFLDIERRRFIRDYDIEIAQAATQHVPVTDGYAIGVSGAIKAELGFDDACVLTYAISDTDESEQTRLLDAFSDNVYAVERSGTEVRRGGGKVECPVLNFATIAGSCRLRPGHTTTVYAGSLSAGWPGGGVLIALTAESIDANPQPFVIERREIVVQDLAAELSSGLPVGTIDFDALRFPNEDFGDSERRLPLALAVGAGAGWNAENRLERALSSLWDQMADDRSVQYTGTTLTVSAPAGESAQILNTVRQRISAGAPRDGVVVASASNGNARRPLLWAGAAGGQALVVAGTQETYVLRYEVDVANNMSASQPEVEAIVSGYAARLSVSGTLDESSFVDAYMVAQLRDGDRNPINLESGQGAINRPAYRMSLLQHDGVIARDAFVPFGVVEIPGRADSTAAKVSLTVR